ncbi:serine/threonine-protein kinase TAO2-like [Mytilus trossulus]|uniref:serine/threonine-protein kinase TAO2-like n=1 Tax=Mytilus trossulus TaxID=6551 RepID=UPI003005CAFA
MELFDKLEGLLKSLTGKVCTEKNIDQALELLDAIKGYTKTQENKGIVRRVDVNDLDKKWAEIGSGHFGCVYTSRYGGSKVAVKIFKEESKSQIREGKILQDLSHENIIAYRGYGYISQTKSQEMNIRVSDGNTSEIMFLVMEYIDQNLLKYVDGMRVHERKGLRYDMVWNIGQQIISALNYLHNLNIAHRDLKPDNILLEVGPRRVVVKLADFGLATHGNEINTNPPRDKRMSSGMSGSIASSSVAHVRWGAPEVLGRKWSLEDYKKADIYCFKNVLTFMLNGERPYDTMSTNTLADFTNQQASIPFPHLPKTLAGPLKNVISKCHQEIPNLRPTAEIILKDFFSLENNPYLLPTDPKTEAEFFSWGFMDKTDIFVADSCTDKEASQIGFYESGMRPTGYDHSDLKCLIEVEKAPYRDRPDEWYLEEDYIDNLDEFMTMARKKVIDNNPTVALKGLAFARPGEEENQLIEFKFKESEYIHHRAMRKIWIDFSNQQKIEELPSKADVHPYFSNTFGLHVAVLTNEGPGKPQKFLFPRRVQREGMAAPGKFTCGAVESASKPDYKIHNGETYVDLVNTAARGLKEELGLELSGSDLDAICLTTVYLKFDTHEWGLCGFVDLTDERIDAKHRISANSLKDIFSTGPKDKFEHQTLTFIDFDLKTMVEFVFNNHENFASSAKLVVVKVLQAFYGWQRVQQEFEIMRHGK